MEIIISIVWNLTYKCIWNCPFCCIDAHSKDIRNEMTVEEKMMVAEKLGEIDCKIDIGGGEIFSDKEVCLHILKKLSKSIGVKHLGISCTGAYIDAAMAESLSEIISEVEMSMDSHPSYKFCYRPVNYHESTAKSVRVITQNNIFLGIQTVLTKHHLNENILESLYEWLCVNKVNKWSVLKFFPFGRGKHYTYLELSEEESKYIVSKIRTLDANNKSAQKPLVDFHYLLPDSGKDRQCRCVKKSIGILPDGSVTACFWGFDSEGRLIDDKFFLGDIKKQSVKEILSGKNADFWRHYTNGCYLNNLFEST